MPREDVRKELVAEVRRTLWFLYEGHVCHLPEDDADWERDARALLLAVEDAGYSICKFPVFPEEADDDEDVYTPSPSEFVSPDDPIIFGRRWKAERDEARAQAENLAEALDELLIGGADAVSMEYAKRAAKVVLRSYRKARDVA